MPLQDEKSQLQKSLDDRVSTCEQTQRALETVKTSKADAEQQAEARGLEVVELKSQLAEKTKEAAYAKHKVEIYYHMQSSSHNFGLAFCTVLYDFLRLESKDLV